MKRKLPNVIKIWENIRTKQSREFKEAVYDESLKRILKLTRLFDREK